MLAKRRLAPSFVRTVPAAALLVGATALPACSKPAEKPAPEIISMNPPMPTAEPPAEDAGATATAPTGDGPTTDAAPGLATVTPTPTDAAGCPTAEPAAGAPCAKAGASCTYHVNGCTKSARCVATDAGPRWDAHFLPCNPPPPRPTTPPPLDTAPTPIHKNPPSPKVG